MPIRTFTLNGKLVSASEDETILDVARENDVDLPSLCHLPGLSSTGACRLCLVEVGGTPQLQPACLTPVAEGMQVTTDSEALQRYRRQIAELLLAERTHVCSVCAANRHCDLQALAVDMELHHVRFEPQAPLLPLDASHPRFVVDHNRCILCTRCVRACDEIEGAHTWDVAGRGANSLVITDLHQRWADATSCTSCGKCVRVCPTGALFEKGQGVTESLRDWEFVKYLKTARERKLWIRREE